MCLFDLRTPHATPGSSTSAATSTGPSSFSAGPLGSSSRGRGGGGGGTDVGGGGRTAGAGGGGPLARLLVFQPGRGIGNGVSFCAFVCVCYSP